MGKPINYYPGNLVHHRRHRKVFEVIRRKPNGDILILAEEHLGFDPPTRGIIEQFAFWCGPEDLC